MSVHINGHGFDGRRHELTVSGPHHFPVGSRWRMSSSGGLSADSDYYVTSVQGDRLIIARGWRSWWARAEAWARSILP